ncbi:hypothetical protein D3C81_2055870 [compost metagenome]
MNQPLAVVTVGAVASTPVPARRLLKSPALLNQLPRSRSPVMARAWLSDRPGTRAAMTSAGAVLTLTLVATGSTVIVRRISLRTAGSSPS